MCDSGLDCKYDYSINNEWHHGYVVDLTPLDKDKTEDKYDREFPFIHGNRIFIEPDSRYNPYICFRHRKEATAYVVKHQLSKKRIRYMLFDYPTNHP